MHYNIDRRFTDFSKPKVSGGCYAYNYSYYITYTNIIVLPESEIDFMDL